MFSIFGHFPLFSKIWSDISKIEEPFGVCPRFFKMFRPAAVNSFGREHKPGRPVNKETRRRIIDLYLVGEGPSAISRSVRVTKGAVWKIIRHYETYDTCPCSCYRRAIHSCTCWCDICRRQVVFDRELFYFKTIIT